MIDDLNSIIIQQQTIIHNLNNTVVFLNETVTVLNSTGFGLPDYDSGWISLGGEFNNIVHNLGTKHLFVYVVGRDSAGNVHHIQYGGAICDIYGTKRGAWWSLGSDNTINVYKELGDNSMWDTCRVLIWRIPQP
jgi:hypothetical protein